MTWYILDENKNVIKATSEEWRKMFEDDKSRRVAWDNIKGDEYDYDVSTIFLGLDHSFCDEGPPIVFETMVFSDDKEHDEDQYRYATYQEALDGHKKICDSLRKKKKKRSNLKRKVRLK